jgi:hypothetical protein
MKSTMVAFSQTSSFVRAHGTAAVNIDRCRTNDGNRHPANVIDDGSDEVVDHVPVSTPGAMMTIRACQCAW